MKAFIFGLIIGLIALPLAVYFYFASGTAPVATSAPAMPFEKMLAHKALDARIEKEMPKTVPIPASEANYHSGMMVYRDNCAVCHGLADGSQTAIAKGMFPKPPLLLHGKGVTDDEPGETYWKVNNGIRLTGMPGFGQSLSATQIWQVSLVLANADKLPDAMKATVSEATVAAPPSTPKPK